MRLLYFLAIFGLFSLAASNTVYLRAAPADWTPMGVYVFLGNGSYEVRVDNIKWLDGADTFCTFKNQTYSLKAGTLKRVNASERFGRDGLGEWREVNFVYTLKDLQSPTFETTFKIYDGQPYVLLGQHFRGHFNGTSVGDKQKVNSGFPSFTAVSEQDLGFLAYGGIMTGDTNKKIGHWNKDFKGIASGLDSGPLVLFDKTYSAIVVSPFNHFMSMSAEYSQDKNNTNTATWGIMGSVTEIPDRTHAWTIMYYSPKGIRTAMEGWGELMTRTYGKDRSYMEADMTLNYLGYWTDNGAYYYYLTEPNKTYEQTILDVKTYSDSINIPYQYIQYDSWWYPKGANEGVTEWTSLDDVFPHGLWYIWNQTGWPAAAHNRWWSNETVYAKQNGGKYNFIVEDNGHAIPLDGSFWGDLLRSSKKWGLILYEQDWLNTEFDELDSTVASIRLGRDWLMQMGNGARKNGMPIQYCMAPSRHILQSLEIKAVTQARVSDDYLYEPDQWKIGISSMFAHAMNIAPFKDNFWTTSHEPNNPYGKIEPFPELQSLVATLSTGPVGPSDKIGCSDPKLIMKSANADGLLLKPEFPARAIDDQIVMKVYRDFQGEVWTTHSYIDGYQFGIIFGADFGDSDILAVTPQSAGFEHRGPMPPAIVFSHKSQDALFSRQNPLMLRGCTKTDFCLYYVTPFFEINGEEVVIYGEMDKWVPVSPQRVKSFEVSGTGDGTDNIKMTLFGAVGETVKFYISVGGKLEEFVCEFHNGGITVLDFKDKTCVYN